MANIAYSIFPKDTCRNKSTTAVCLSYITALLQDLQQNKVTQTQSIQHMVYLTQIIPDMGITAKPMALMSQDNIMTSATSSFTSTVCLERGILNWK